MDPFLSLTSLSTDIEDLKLQPLQFELEIKNTTRLLTCADYICEVRNIVWFRDPIQLSEEILGGIHKIEFMSVGLDQLRSGRVQPEGLNLHRYLHIEGVVRIRWALDVQQGWKIRFGDNVVWFRDKVERLISFD
ncbi:hypothetical protein WICPIJ_008559 [Wickerhamomyces pijperi]|uniref:Uncharacterized protein n=1 Tax=Wickerhamomyces pijperi TaxID=599730 RepID=A0A9P8PWG6_WICPI|nr:hypothetical protein WICPIJ_008559 [Wickerhamomyces pijperi]